MGTFFNHLNVPQYWRQYWDKYPEGYTILEALLNWVSQVDSMVDNVNTWNTYLDNFVKTFDTELQTTVYDQLVKWRDDGTLQAIFGSIVYQTVYAKAFGVVGDGVTDDTAKLQEAIDYAKANNMPLSAENMVMRITNVTLSKNTYKFNGSSFISARTIANVIPAIDVQDGANVDSLVLKTEPTFNAGNAVMVRGNAKITTIKVTSDTQTALYSVFTDSAVYVAGDNNSIGEILVDRFDYGVTLYNIAKNYIGRISVTNYRRAIYIRKAHVKNHILDLSTRLKSPNSGWSAGNNGLLIEESEHLWIDVVQIEDAGEHGFRLGGARDGEYLQNDFHFGSVTVKNASGCGFKAFTGEINGEPLYINNVYIDTLTVINANYGLPNIVNRDGIHLEVVRDFYIGTYTCTKEASPAYSANCGIYVNGAMRIFINAAQIYDTGKEGILLEDTQGYVNDFYINSLIIKGTGAELIRINHPTQSLRDVVIKNLYGRQYDIGHWGVNISHSYVYQPVVIEGYINSIGTLGAFTNTSANGLIFNKITEVNQPS